MLEGTGSPAEPPDRTEDAVEQATLLLAEGMTRREVARRLSETLGLSRNDAYRLVMELPWMIRSLRWLLAIAVVALGAPAAGAGAAP